MAERLRKVTMTRDGERWIVVRERETTGETFHADDLLEAFEIVNAAYRPDGTPRPYGETGEDGLE